ncbi:hypothetical protein DUNSADRAFT_9251 [Dunaliella salina]|uniref:Encoded protein n=1 Tax=Dunaliella salina TaxID=3046 RepID=A0ABQ7GHU2_DUNSA|nr:hypothetical protein DUNSADRAFT_9251 [Dunaliella salina]|eukprot:KAF5834177.1 hypothetical protein DUNSADRAFT_9251 [Dunaliella salina]
MLGPLRKGSFVLTDGVQRRRASHHHLGFSEGRSLHVNPIVRRGAAGHELRSATTCSTREPAHHSHAGSGHADLEREREVVLEEPVLLQELEPGSSQPLSIDPAAAAQLLPDGRSDSKKQQHINLSSKDRFVLGYEVDGMLQPHMVP